MIALFRSAWVALAWLVSGVVSQGAVYLGFDSADEFDRNFWRAGGSGEATWEGGRLVKGDGTNSAASLIYNSGATGGVGGSGGTAPGASLDRFENFRMEIAFRTNDFGSSANSLGFYVKGNDSLTAGYLVVFRLSSGSGGPSDMRVFGPDTTMSAVGGPLLASTTIAPSGTFATSLYYPKEENRKLAGSLQMTHHQGHGISVGADFDSP